MDEKLKEYVDMIISSDKLCELYADLSEMFAGYSMFEKQTAFLEREWHINQDLNLMKQIGDILIDKFEDYETAYFAYDIYLKQLNPEFYASYRKTLIQNGCESLKNIKNSGEKTSELIRLSDRFCSVVDLMEFVFIRKDYDSVF